MPTESTDILQVSEALIARLTPGDLEATLNSITEAAVEVLPLVDFASITMRHPDGTLDSYALTDERLNALDERQFELQEGPCFEGVTDSPFSMAADLAADPRYPRY